MPSRNHRPQPPHGREKPIGPVLALAETTSAFEAPVLRDVRWDEDPQSGSKVKIYDGFKMNKGESVGVNIVAIRAGSIAMEQVNPHAEVSAAQRRAVEYEHGGGFSFPTSALHMNNPELWGSLEDPGILIAMSGLLYRVNGGLGGPQFELRPNMWDAADLAQHGDGSLIALPQTQAQARTVG